MSNKPAKTLRDGTIKATIWKNQGEKGAYYSVDLSRGYKDNNGAWQETTSFSGTDLLKVSHLASRAYDAIANLRESDNQPEEQAA